MKKWLIILCCLFCLVGKGQIITTVAGSGAATYSGNSSPATAAGIPDPIGGIFDQYGNYYFADAVGSCRIRKIDATGIITTIAGNGTPAFSGDNGPATMAALNLPCAVKLDTAGNVFIVDANNYRIRKVDAVTGIITTVAGTGAHAFGGDSGPATAAALNGPNDICFDKQGNLYIADLSNYRIRKINTAGIITTIAGNGTFGSTGDGGPATAAQISGSPGLAIDNSGNIYIAERGGNRVRKVNTAGIITTFAGNGVAAYLGDGIPATNAQISPGKVYFDTMTDQLYIADDYNERIFVVDGSGIIRHIGGNGTNGFSGDGGPAKAAQLEPAGISMDKCGNLYIPVVDPHRIRKIDFNPHCWAASIPNAVPSNTLSIYPNPANDVIHIDGVGSSSSYRLLSIVGVVVRDGLLRQGSNSISVQSLPAGVYVVEVIGDGDLPSPGNGYGGRRRVVSKVVKE